MQPEIIPEALMNLHKPRKGGSALATLLNVVIQPPPAIRQAAIALSGELAMREKAHFVLDGKEFHPHVTLYKAHVPRSSVEKVLEQVVDLADHPALLCRFGGIESGRGYILVRLVRSGPLDMLHAQIISAVNPLRVPGARVRVTRDLTSAEEKNNALYGHPNVLDTFSPHMTIVRLHDVSAAAHIAEKLTWMVDSFLADTVAVYRMGDHGTCRVLIGAASLSAYE